MKRRILSTIAVLGAVSISISSCQNTAQKPDSKSDTLTVVNTASTGVTINPLQHAEDFPGATLKVKSIVSEKVGTDSAKVTVKYEVENFNLTEQTSHEDHLANSHDGQHIHFILDNKPYAALYKPEHSAVVSVNSEHTLLSFLSRSFHESLKKDGAYEVIKFKILSDGNLEKVASSTSPSLFYSRPKGEYVGEDTKQILLDFYVLNCKIGPGDYQVVANVNGKDFKLDQWVPYEILGLPMGENKVKLTLVDSKGNLVTGENASIERTFNLKAE